MNRLRLRQICLVAEKLAPIEQALIEVLGVAVCYRDPAVDHFGLENALFPVGNQLLEVVAPVREHTAGGRYLERRGGDGGYMVITQCDHHPPYRQRVDDLGIRIVLDAPGDEIIHMQLHPADTGGTFFEIDQQLGHHADADDGPWHPAGPNWQARRKTDRVTGILAAEIQCDDPLAVAHRWAEIAGLDLEISNDHAAMKLMNASVRFVPCTDGRPEGLGGIDLAVADKAAILHFAAERGLPISEDQITICGTRMNLI